MNTDCIHHFSSPQFSLQSLGKNTSDASVVSSVVSSHSKKENVFFFFCCCGWFFTYIFAQSCHLETVMVWLYLYVLLLFFFFFKKTLFAITKMTLKINVKHVGASKSHTTNSTWLVEWSPSVYSHSTVAGRGLWVVWCTVCTLTPHPPPDSHATYVLLQHPSSPLCSTLWPKRSPQVALVSAILIALLTVCGLRNNA